MCSSQEQSHKMGHFYSRASFVIGLVLGVILALFVSHWTLSGKNSPLEKNPPRQPYVDWFQKRGINRTAVPWDEMRYTNKSLYTEADYLFDNIRILCIVLVRTPNNLVAVNATWARGCNSFKQILLPSRTSSMPSKQDKALSSWVLLCKMLHETDPGPFDWVIVVKDTSFVILENFRHYVAPLDSEKCHYLGHAVQFWGTVYNSGDPGYALSKGALKAIQKGLLPNECTENSYRNKEDFYLGKVLSQLNITPVSTVDEEGLSTFHPYTWYHVFFPGESYYKTSVFPVKCCSRRSIAFQAIEGSRMYTFQYLFYKLQIFQSGQCGNRPFKDSVSEDKVWKDFLTSQNVYEYNINSEQYYKLWEKLVNDPNSFASSMKKEELFDYD